MSHEEIVDNKIQKNNKKKPEEPKHKKHKTALKTWTTFHGPGPMQTTIACNSWHTYIGSLVLVHRIIINTKNKSRCRNTKLEITKNAT